MSGSVIVTTDRLFDFTRAIKLTVGQGEDAKTYTIHSDIIRRADFFRARLKKEWKQGDETEIKLVEDDPVTVGMYLHLLYNGSIPVREPGVKPGRGYKNEVEILAALYVFSDKVGDVLARNISLEAIIDLSSVSDPTTGTLPLPSKEVLGIIYNGTVEGNRARQFLVDLYASRATASHLNSDGWPLEFFVELSCLLITRSSSTRHQFGNPCQQKQKYREAE